MNKAELIEAIASDAELSKAAATRVLDTILGKITDTLAHNGQVTLIGFGNFLVRPRAARKCRNPQTGEMIDVPATRVAVFKAGKALKDAVHKESE